jgi:predicted enzyme related to lactoylglutathione lyase
MTQGLNTLTPKVKDAYLVWIYKAINELLFLGEAKKAQKSYEMAAKWAFLQNDKTSRAIGKQAQEASQFLAEDPDSKQVQASAWLMVLSNAKDQKTLRLALAKIQSLGGNVTMDQNRVIVSFPSNK